MKDSISPRKESMKRFASMAPEQNRTIAQFGGKIPHKPNIAYEATTTAIRESRYILSADDDPDDQTLIRLALEECNFPLPCLFFEDGGSVVNHLQSSSILPSLVILDVNMPVLTGIQVLKFIKSDEKFGDLPVVIFSTATTDIIKNHCLSLGASRYISKPMDFSEIVDVMDSLKTFIEN